MQLGRFARTLRTMPLTEKADRPAAPYSKRSWIHDGGWTLDPVADGTWRLARPDGTTIDPPRYPGEQRPPPRAGPPG